MPEQNASGWTATVDGQPASIVAVDSMSQGLLLEPGHHTIELRYVAPGSRAGLLLSFLSVLGVLVLAWEPWRRRRGGVGRIRTRRRAPARRTEPTSRSPGTRQHVWLM